MPKLDSCSLMCRKFCGSPFVQNNDNFILIEKGLLTLNCSTLQTCLSVSKY